MAFSRYDFKILIFLKKQVEISKDLAATELVDGARRWFFLKEEQKLLKKEKKITLAPNW